MHRSTTRRRAARLVACSAATASARSPSNAPTARSSTPCSGRADRRGDQPRTRSRTCAGATARPATRTTGSMPTCSPTPCAPTGPACVRWSPTPQPPWRCAALAGPARTWSNHRVAVANQLRAHLRTCLPRRRRLVRRPRLRDQPGVPEPLRLPGPRRLADPQAARRLAGQQRLLRRRSTPRCCTNA